MQNDKTDKQHTRTKKPRPGTEPNRGERQDGLLCGVLVIWQNDFAMLTLEVGDVAPQKIQHFAGYRAPVILRDILELVMQFSIYMQTEVLVLFHRCALR